jgi:hypothetical protein
LKSKDVRFRDALRVYEFATSHSIDRQASLAFDSFKELGDTFKFSRVFILLKQLDCKFYDTHSELRKYFNERASLSTETITKEEINDVKLAIPSSSVSSIMLLNMLELKLSLQKYEESECRKTSIP